MIDDRKKAKITTYLETSGIHNNWWTYAELIEIERTESNMFEGCETGYLRFSKTSSGRRYIQFLPSRCYLD
jgi:hypothetical protein